MTKKVAAITNPTTISILNLKHYNFLNISQTSNKKILIVCEEICLLFCSGGEDIVSS